MAVINLLDIAKANGADQAVGLVDEASRLTPEVTHVPWRTIKGMNYKFRVRVQEMASAFRAANQGTLIAKGIYEERLVEALISETLWNADMAVADKYEFGSMAYFAEEAVAAMRGKFLALGRQFFYGRTAWNSTGTNYTGVPANFVQASYPNGGDPNGCPGLLDGFNTTYEYDALGSTANTGSSVWGVKVGEQNVTWIAGANGSFDLRDVSRQQLTDPNNSAKFYMAYIQSLAIYPGLQLGDLRSVCRIRNLTEDSGHTLTDKMLMKVLALLPGGFMPDAWFMSRRSLSDLQQSRTATNPTGKEAEIPRDVMGIPILMTDSINNIEPIGLETAAI